MPLPASERPSETEKEREAAISPLGVAVCILATLMAIPVLVAGRAAGAGDSVIASGAVQPVVVSTTSAASSSVAPAPTTALVSTTFLEADQPEADQPDSDQAAAAAALAAALGAIDHAGSAADQQSPVLTATAAVPTTVHPTTTVPTTAAPTTAPQTTAAPTTRAPTTAAPTTAPPATADTTAPPATNETTEPVASTTTLVGNGEPNAEQWSQLRFCEASGNYQIISGNGLYYGAYQFGIPTWNGLARNVGRSDLVGVRPSDASVADQDWMALMLWRSRGPQPWPVCGRYLPPLP